MRPPDTATAKRRETLLFAVLDQVVVVLTKIFLRSEAPLTIGGFRDIWLKAGNWVGGSRTKSALRIDHHKEMAYDPGVWPGYE